MAIRCGFFNSVGDDRKYSAEDMNEPYKDLISNGVFAKDSNYLYVEAQSGMVVNVKAGRGIFGDKWFVSNSDVTLTLSSASPSLNRIDSIVVRVDSTQAVRSASIIVRTGIASSSPVAPSVFRDDYVSEYRLADIEVKAGATSITQANITDRRSSKDCGWVTSLVQQVDTDTLYTQWQTAFEEWFTNVKDTLASTTLIRSYESTYTTTKQDETSIPINIEQFNRNLDILQVYINGLMLVKGLDYSIADDTKITLTNGVDIGTQVSFVVYKSIDGSEAEGVVQQVYELQNDVTDLQNANPTPLYNHATGVYPNAGSSITPSKSLSECRGGWMLVWTGFDTSGAKFKDEYIQTVLIPKRSHKGSTWAGESMTFSFVYSTDGSTTSQCVKTIKVYDTRIESSVSYNGTGNNRNIVLKAIYEY